MVAVEPFRGLRYAPSFARAAVFAPPYDVIDAADRGRLLASDPYNVVRLILNATGEDDWFTHAAGTLARWQCEGVLQRDPRPALYGYRQTFSLDGREWVRTGVVARVRLKEWGDGIHRHERTKVGPRAERLRLLRATRSNLSPVFGLYSDPTGEVLAQLGEAPPVVDATIAGVRETFWVVDDTAAIGAVRQALAGREVVIADGHHRYETALAYRGERRAAEGDPVAVQPYDYVLMYLAAREDPGVRVLATHRVITGVGALHDGRLVGDLATAFEITSCPQGLRLAEAIVPSAPGPVAIGLCLAGRRHILRLRPEVAARVGRDDRTAVLDVNVLQNQILAPHLGVDAEQLATGEHVAYTNDEDEACGRVARGEAQAAFILSPTPLDEVWRAALQGVTMPQKSTYFYPKLLTGLVLNPLSEV